MRLSCRTRPRHRCRTLLEYCEPRLLLSTYYVSNSGNDANPGTLSAPKATMQAIVSRLLPGDVLNVMPGTYAGFLVGWDNPGQHPYGELHGTAAAPITIQANPGSAPGSVVIRSRNPLTADGINIENSDFVTVQGFTINNADGTITRAGIRAANTNGIVIRNNSSDRQGLWGIFTSFSNNILIENNTTSNSQIEHGIYHSNSGDNPIIRNNHVFGNRGNGIHMNGDISQGGDGLISFALVEGNIVHDNGVSGGSGINCDGVQNSVFRNNILYNNHASGISLYNIDSAAGSINNTIVNNTIHMPAGGRWCINIKNQSTGATVFNNILLNNDSFTGSINCVTDSLAGFTSDYNVVKDRFSVADGDTTYSLAQWRSNTGQDQHSFTATAAALFVNSGAADYHLNPTSPAINAGVGSLAGRTAPPADYEGTYRPQGAAWDIGADERLSIVSNNTIAARRIYYRGSVFDTGDHSAAIAADKSALLPGQAASFPNYTSYSRGINGILIDFTGILSGITAADFQFRVGNSSSTATWTTAPAPQSITVIAGPAGTQRVVIAWADNAIQNRWLQVTVLANAATGLAASDTFYFGNAIGDTGDSIEDARVTSADQIRARANATTNANVLNHFDFNRDGAVNAADQSLADASLTTVLNALQLITPPATLVAASTAKQPPVAPATSIYAYDERRVSVQRFLDFVRDSRYGIRYIRH